MAASVPPSLFRRLLGEAFDTLPAPIQRVHDERTRKVLTGRCRIARGSGCLARVLARIASLPAAGDGLPVQVLIETDGQAETWSRDFAGQPMRSRLRERGACLDEVLGPLGFRFALRANERAIDWTVVRVRALGLPLPVAWFAGVSARESVVAGRYTFDVRAELPWIGLLVHYHGWLEAADEDRVS
jgi:hypothetical protein